ncbi:MAG: hypothetical protein Fur0012_05420 [Elusimicrobiota bacterium]
MIIFFYVVWADTATYSGYTPLSDANNSSSVLPNASIFAIKMVKSGNTYQKDTSFGSSGLLRITDRFDQSVEDLPVFPYNNGFVVVYSTSSASNPPVGFVQYYESNGVAQLIHREMVYQVTLHLNLIHTVPVTLFHSQGDIYTTFTQTLLLKSDTVM